MTPISKPKTIRTPDYYLRIDPAGLISIREPRARTWYNFPIARLYTLAALATADAALSQRKRRTRP